MKQYQADKLLQLFNNGFKIKCTQGPYVDGFIDDIYHHDDKGRQNLPIMLTLRVKRDYLIEVGKES